MVNKKEVKELVQYFDELMTEGDKYIGILEKDNKALAEEVLFLTELVKESARDGQVNREKLNEWTGYARDLEVEFDDLEFRHMELVENVKTFGKESIEDNRIMNSLIFISGLIVAASLNHYFDPNYVNPLMLLAGLAALIGIRVRQMFR